MRRVKRSRQPKPDILTAAWVNGDPPPAEAAEDKDRLVGLIFFGEHPPKRWKGPHHPHQRAWLDALADLSCCRPLSAAVRPQPDYLGASVGASEL